MADAQLAGTPSQLFDAVALVLSSEGCSSLESDSAAHEFVGNAYAHLKAVGANEAAQPLLEKARIATDSGVTGIDSAFIEAAKIRHWEREAKLRMLA
jgi:catalase